MLDSGKNIISHPDFREIQPFELLEPVAQTLPFVFNSPHSGNFYPSRFLDASRLDSSTIRRSEDIFVDDLFENMPKLGAPLLKANFPRAYLDLNREPYELDPKMFDGELPSYANIRSIRVAGGLGTIARVVAESLEIYKHRITVEDALLRIEALYRPYHACLRKLLAKTHVTHGKAFLIDCHSMPSGQDDKVSRPDFVLGDRYGASCSNELTEMLACLLSDRGYVVNRNKPYAGGFITEHYGRPSAELHALQIEINRSLYANEQELQKNSHFDQLKIDLTDVFSEVFDVFSSEGSLPLAAE